MDEEQANAMSRLIGLDTRPLVTVIEMMEAPAIVTDPGGIIVAFNQVAVSVFGLPRDGMLGQELMSALHVVDRSQANRVVWDKLDSAGSWHGQLLRHGLDGQATAVMVNCVALRDGNGEIRGALAVIEPSPRSRTDVLAQVPEAMEGDRLRRALAEVETIYNAAPIGICLLDTNLRFVRVNRKFTELTGRSPEEHNGRSIYEIAPRIAPLIERIVQTVLATGKSLTNIEIEAETPSMPGVLRSQRESYSPIKDEEGNIIGVIIVTEDYTDRKRLIKQLEDAKGRLEAILNQTPVGLYILEAPRGNITFVNAEVPKMFRGEFDFSIIKGIEDYGRLGALWPNGQSVPPEQYPSARSIRTGEVVRNELFSGQRADGSRIWYQISSAPVYSGEGQIVAAISMMVDVTDQVEVQDKIVELMKASETERIRLQTILDTLPIGIIITDRHGKLLTENYRNREIWRGGPERAPQSLPDYMDYPIWSIDKGDFVTPEDRPMYRVLVQGLTVNGERYCMRRFDGSTGQVMISGAPIRNNEGEVVGGVIVVQDITDIQRIEIELAERAQDLARSNAELQQFAYVASHDLREPLRMISSYLSLLEDRYMGRVLDAKAEEYVRYASDGAVRMQQMINDLLAYSRIGTAGGTFAPTDLCTAVKTAQNNLAMAIRETGAVVRCDSLPTIWADRMQMVQLFQNLIDNAIKYRGRAIPVVEITAAPHVDSWLFSVTDNGLGIAEGMQDKIFQMFQRGFSHDERPGTGIGLAIAKKIVERHGGRIWVESEEGKGSTFKILLPEKPYRDQQAGPSDRPSASCRAPLSARGASIGARS